MRKVDPGGDPVSPVSHERLIQVTNIGGLLPSLTSVQRSCLSTDVFDRTEKTTDPGKPGAPSGGTVQQHARAHLMTPLWEAAARRQPSPRPISVRCSPYG